MNEWLESTYPIPEGIMDSIHFHGHKNIIGSHRNTLEITRENEISKRADCIIGVRSSKGCSGLSPALAKHIQNSGALSFVIRVENYSFAFSGIGSSELTLKHDSEIVLRRSDYVSERTAAIHCSAAAIDIPREIVWKLKDPTCLGILEVRAVASPAEKEFEWTLP